jgi:hypothetical protein
MSTPQPWLEQLIAWATPEATKDDLLAARKDFFARSGEVFDDDKQLEQRMASFLEFYVCDRVAPHHGATPARARYLEALKAEAPERAAAWRAFTETNHGLFEVRRIKPTEVRLRGLFSGIDFEVSERRQLAGINPGDVLESRLVPFGGLLHFSPTWCFHPHEAAKRIKLEARRLVKAGTVDEAAFAADCAQRSLKADRYRQIAVEKIYDFSSKLF